MVLNPGPLYHNAPFSVTHLSLMFGGHVVGMRCFDPLEALRLIDAYKVSWVNLVPELLCFVPMLEADDGVIRIADDNYVALSGPLSPALDPEIADVVKINVRQQRTDDSALRRPLLGLRYGLTGTAMEISRFPCRRRVCMPGSSTTQVATRLAIATCAMWPSAGPENIGTPNLSYAAQYLACTFPCQPFA